MSQLPTPDSNQSPKPKSSIEQHVDNSTLGNGMQGVQGDKNNLVQGSNNLLNNFLNVFLAHKTLAPKRTIIRPIKQRFLLETPLKLLKLFIAAIGLAITIHFLVNRQWIAALISLLLTVTLLICLILKGTFLLVYINLINQKWQINQQKLANRWANKFEERLE
ncbi:hypothetical protein GNF10_33375, partial [Nostoc sp. UCD121]|nr:hypothetical protein [Nostoc sp. UCD121]